jgi:hypothetical protein
VVGGLAVADQSLGALTLTWYHVLGFFSVEVCEIISVDDIATLLARIFEANLSVVKGILTCNWAEWTITLM